MVFLCATCVQKKRLHCVSHLDEEYIDLLIIVLALHVQLDHDAKHAHRDCDRASPSATMKDRASGMILNRPLINGCTFAMSSRILRSPGRLSTNMLKPSWMAFKLSLLHAASALEASSELFASAAPFTTASADAADSTY